MLVNIPYMEHLGDVTLGVFGEVRVTQYGVYLQMLELFIMYNGLNGDFWKWDLWMFHEMSKFKHVENADGSF